MMELLGGLFDSEGFTTPGRGAAWTQALSRLHVGADLAIGIASLGLAGALGCVAVRRKDLGLSKLLWLFSLFALACGIVQLVDASTFSSPWQRLAGLSKVVAAVVSVASAVSLAVAMPGILAPPQPQSLDADVEPATANRRRADAMFQSALEACPSGVLMVDRSGTITFANSLIRQWLGYDADELVGQSVERLVPAYARSFHPELVQSYFRQPMPRSLGEGRDLVGVCKDGAEIPIEIGLHPLATPSGMQALVNVVNNSRRKKLEAQLGAKARDLESLMYTVTHDLRSPLVTIEGFANMIGEHLGAKQLDLISDDLERVKRAARTMAQLIGDVLELSRLNRTTMKIDAVNVREVIDDAATSLESDLRCAEARLVVHDELPWIRTDRTWLLRIFMNLLGNALKYGCTSPGGTITVGGKARGQEVAFFVQDEGVGVELSAREKIFQPFQQGTPGGGGSGLGLAIVRTIMELQDGRAWVETAPGGGAVFWIAFPAAAACPAHEAAGTI
jgi:PAS domain S-box-containing protein